MSDLKRVLVVFQGAVPSPQGKARRVAAALEAWGPRMQVDALTSKVEGEPHIERFGGARLMRVPLAGGLVARLHTFERALRRQLASEEYDLVFLADAFGVGTVLRRRTQTPFKVVVDGSELQRQLWAWVSPELASEPRVRHRLLRYERHVLAQADAVVSGGEGQDAVLTGLGVPAERIRRIWPSVACESFPETPPPSEGPMVVAALCNGTPWETLEPALGAIALARKQGTNVHLRIGGPLPPARRQQLRDLADSLEIGDALELPGEIPEGGVGEFLAAAHACLCTIRPPPGADMLPLGAQRLAEALASGRPVVASDVPSQRELAGDAALYLPTGDPQSFAHIFAQLARPGSPSAAIGQRGRERARERYDVLVAKEAWLDLAKELLGSEGIAMSDMTGPMAALEGDSPTLSFEPTQHGVLTSNREPTPIGVPVLEERRGDAPTNPRSGRASGDETPIPSGPE